MIEKPCLRPAAEQAVGVCSGPANILVQADFQITGSKERLQLFDAFPADAHVVNLCQAIGEGLFLGFEGIGARHIRSRIWRQVAAQK